MKKKDDFIGGTVKRRSPRSRPWHESSLRKSKIMLCLIAVAGLPSMHHASALSRRQGTVHYLMVKYGDESADQKVAAEFLEKLSRYLQSTVPAFRDKVVLGWIANTPQLAGELLEKYEPILAFVPPGFYLEFLNTKEQQSTPILQVPRFGSLDERFYVVTTQNGPNSFSELKGHCIRTIFAVDLKYLSKIVFPAKFRPGVFFDLEPSQNLADEVFLMLENAAGGFGVGEVGAASALLFDEELKRFFEEDELVWPKLKIIWVSASLPRDLVVTIGETWSEESKKQVKGALENMKNDSTGLEILDLMQSSGFVPVDISRLEQVIEKYGRRE